MLQTATDGNGDVGHSGSAEEQSRLSAKREPAFFCFLVKNKARRGADNILLLVAPLMERKTSEFFSFRRMLDSSFYIF